MMITRETVTQCNLSYEELLNIVSCIARMEGGSEEADLCDYTEYACLDDFNNAHGSNYLSAEALGEVLTVVQFGSGSFIAKD